MFDKFTHHFHSLSLFFEHWSCQYSLPSNLQFPHHILEKLHNLKELHLQYAQYSIQINANIKHHCTNFNLHSRSHIRSLTGTPDSHTHIETVIATDPVTKIDITLSDPYAIFTHIIDYYTNLALASSTDIDPFSHTNPVWGDLYAHSHNMLPACALLFLPSLSMKFALP